MIRLLEDFAQISCDWFWEMDANLRFTYFSKRWEVVFGFSPDREIGKSRLQVAQNAEDQALWKPHIEDLLARRPFRDLTYPYRHQDGTVRWLRVSGQPVFGLAGEFEGYRGVGTNVTAEIEADEKLAAAVTELKRANQQLEIQNLLFDTALNNMSHGLCMWDTHHRIIVCNNRFLEIYGFSPEVVKPGVSLREVLKHSVTVGNHPGDSLEQLYETYVRELDTRGSFTIERHLKDQRTIIVTHQPMSDGSWVATYEEVTERKRVEAQIRHMAHHDALTNLPNRLLFREQMLHGLQRLESGEKLAVICLDLDGFKSVNDALGHAIGDALLRAVTERLLKCIGDKDTVARLGGDEFAVLQAAAGDRDEAAGLASILINAVAEPYDLEGHEVIIGTSVGIALAPSDGVEPDELLKKADMALYQAKNDGRGVFRFFKPEMDVSQRARHVMEQDLNRALAEGQFDLFYQPVINLESGRVTSCEALLRWHHPSRGLVMPGEFIGLAEETGLIIPLGEWVLRQACRQASQWPGDIKIAVNLSAIQFRRRNLVEVVIRALAFSGLPANRLELEVTESVLLVENDRAFATLHQLRDLGVRIAVDDFGTGYSGFSYLRKYPFDKIKIDRSFISESSGHGIECAAIIKAIAGVGNSLGMMTTAEGVETDEQLQLVRAEGCTEVQGYLFSHPRPANEILNFITKSSSAIEKVA